MTASENRHPQGARHQTVREVTQQIVNSHFCLMQCILYAPVNQRQIGFVATFIVIAFQGCGGQIELTQHIAQTRRDTLATFQAATQHRHRHIREQRQVGTDAVQVLVITAGAIAGRAGAGTSGG